MCHLGPNIIDMRECITSSHIVTKTKFSGGTVSYVHGIKVQNGGFTKRYTGNYRGYSSYTAKFLFLQSTKLQSDYMVTITVTMLSHTLVPETGGEVAKRSKALYI